MDAGLTRPPCSETPPSCPCSESVFHGATGQGRLPSTLPAAPRQVVFPSCPSFSATCTDLDGLPLRRHTCAVGATAVGRPLFPRCSGLCRSSGPRSAPAICGQCLCRAGDCHLYSSRSKEVPTLMRSHGVSTRMREVASENNRNEGWDLRPLLTLPTLSSARGTMTPPAPAGPHARCPRHYPSSCYAVLTVLPLWGAPGGKALAPERCPCPACSRAVGSTLSTHSGRGSTVFAELGPPSPLLQEPLGSGLWDSHLLCDSSGGQPRPM